MLPWFGSAIEKSRQRFVAFVAQASTYQAHILYRRVDSPLGFFVNAEHVCIFILDGNTLTLIYDPNFTLYLGVESDHGISTSQQHHRAPVLASC